MKKLFVALSLILSSTAMAGQYVTVNVCDGGESGVECRTVTYKVRPATATSKAQVEDCKVLGGEAGSVPCASAYGVPAWLKRLNESFSRFGGKPVDQFEIVGGP